MILAYTVSLPCLIKQQKDYPWKRPSECPRCKGAKLWGHGYVLKYFNSSPVAVFVKRWRCPACSLTITCRPASYWRRFQESISNIFTALSFRIRMGRWPPFVPRQRGGHWLRKLIEKARVDKLIKPSPIKTVEFYRQKKLVIF